MTQFSQNDWQTLSPQQLQTRYLEMVQKVESRRKTCRESSKKYYHKTYKLSETPSVDEVEKNKKTLERRDKYQKSYYEKNKEKIREKQKAYRLAKKAEKEAGTNSQSDNDEATNSQSE